MASSDAPLSKRAAIRAADNAAEVEEPMGRMRRLHPGRAFNDLCGVGCRQELGKVVGSRGRGSAACCGLSHGNVLLVDMLPLIAVEQPGSFGRGDRARAGYCEFGRWQALAKGTAWAG